MFAQSHCSPDKHLYTRSQGNIKLVAPVTKQISLDTFDQSSGALELPRPSGLLWSALVINQRGSSTCYKAVIDCKHLKVVRYYSTELK